jgi:hypothetical protein
MSTNRVAWLSLQAVLVCGGAHRDFEGLHGLLLEVLEAIVLGLQSKGRSATMRTTIPNEEGTQANIHIKM